MLKNVVHNYIIKKTDEFVWKVAVIFPEMHIPVAVKMSFHFFISMSICFNTIQF